jgi:dynein heavy chain
MLSGQRKANQDKVDRYQNGCDKIASTKVMVEQLQTEIRKLQPVLVVAGRETAELIEVVTKDKAAAKVVQENVETEAAKVKIATDEAAEIARDAQTDLDEALPAFDSAVKALKSLNKADITEIKNFANPPELVKTTLEAVCILKGAKPTWEDAKKILNDSNFLTSLEQYDKDNIPEKYLKALAKYIANPDFVPEKVEKVSKAAKSLCMWCRGTQFTCFTGVQNHKY